MKAHFEAFVNSQPADKEINHMWGWGECAVGEFANSINLPVYQIVGNLYLEYGTNRNGEAISIIYNTSVIPYSENETLMDLLNSSNFVTYGELQQYLLDTII